MTETAFHLAIPVGRLDALRKRAIPGLRLWRRRRHTRRQLSELGGGMLRDIGVTPDEALREIRKSFPWHCGPDAAGALRPADEIRWSRP